MIFQGLVVDLGRAMTEIPSASFFQKRKSLPPSLLSISEVERGPKARVVVPKLMDLDSPDSHRPLQISHSLVEILVLQALESAIERTAVMFFWRTAVKLFGRFGRFGLVSLATEWGHHHHERRPSEE